VLARLSRLCGADYSIAGSFGGALFDSDDEVRANLDALRGPCGAAKPAVGAFGGGLRPEDVARQAAEAGGDGLVMLLGSQAYGYPGGLEAGVRAAVATLAVTAPTVTSPTVRAGAMPAPRAGG
jgi:ribulose 1,5-bisphosphate carboxylase large subunit-like protein